MSSKDVELVLYDDQTADASSKDVDEEEPQRSTSRKYSSLTHILLHASNTAWTIMSVFAASVYAFSLFLAVHMISLTNRVLFQDVNGDFELNDLSVWLVLYALFSGITYGSFHFVINRMKLKFERIASNSFWSTKWERGTARKTNSSAVSEKEKISETILYLSGVIFDSGTPRIYLGVVLTIGSWVVIGSKSTGLFGYSLLFFDRDVHLRGARLAFSRCPRASRPQANPHQ